MLNTLIIGLGRAGLGLHVPVVSRLREAHAGRCSPILPLQPIVAVDPYRSYGAPLATGSGRGPGSSAGRGENTGRGAAGGPGPADPCHLCHAPGLVLADSLAEARGLLDPGRTVVHLCTPPAVRSALLREAAGLGFTHFIVEKPAAAGEAELQAVLSLAARHGLRLSVVAPWLHSTVTERLTALLHSGALGRLQTMTITQHKPRFRRSLADRCHGSALDVEIPHSLGLALQLAGDADVVSAATTDLVVHGTVVPAMGSAALVLRHRSGVHTAISSDLTAPERRRRIVLELTGGRVTADYPIGEDDDHARLRVSWRGHRNAAGSAQSCQVFRDDALGTFLARTYRRYAEGGGGDLERHVRTCELLNDAKRHSEPVRLHPTAPCTTAAGRTAPCRPAAVPAPPGIVYAGIGDEAGRTPDEQIAAVAALGWSAIELRTVDGTAVADLPDADFARLAERLHAAGLQVVCIASRIGDWSRPISHPFEVDRAELDVLARRCRETGTRFIRVMSYPNDALSTAEWRRRVLHRLGALAEYAEARGVVLLHENCSGWAGKRAERMLDLLRHVGSPSLRLLFDTGNGVVHGYDSAGLLADLVPYVGHVHIKDAVSGPDGVAYTLPGRGSAKVADCLAALFAGGYTGALSIEPHLALRPHQSRTAAAPGAMAGFIACGRELERLVHRQMLPRLRAPEGTR